MKFYISDLHLFHDNIIKFCNRPFGSSHQMTKTIIANWNKKVGKNDEVYILGDMFFRYDDIKDVVNILKQLNGKKHLIRGNHDKWVNDPRTHQYFESIKQYDEVDDGGRRVILFHYPMEEWNGYYRNSYHLFGHVHNSVEHLSVVDRRYNVSADVINFTPQTLTELIAANEHGKI